MTTCWQQYCANLVNRPCEAAVWRGGITRKFGKNLSGVNYADIPEAHDQYMQYITIHGYKAASIYRLAKEPKAHGPMYNSCIQQAVTFYLGMLQVLIHPNNLKIIPQ